MLYLPSYMVADWCLQSDAMTEFCNPLFSRFRIQAKERLGKLAESAATFLRAEQLQASLEKQGRKTDGKMRCALNGRA